MQCAVVKMENGNLVHYTEVKSISLIQRRKKIRAKVEFTDNSVAQIEDAVSVKMVDDFWYVRNQLGIGV